MSVDAPIAGIRGRDAFGARRVGGAVEEGEVGGDEIGSGRHADRELGREMI